MNRETDYNLRIPTSTYTELKAIAAQEGTTVADLLRRATRLLLFIRSIKDDSGARLLLEREGEILEVTIDLI